MILFSHPTGNANVRAALSGFLNEGMLFEFDTAIASFEGTILHQLSSLKPLAEIGRRNFDPALRKFTHTFPWYEAARLLSLRGGVRNLVKHETGIFCIDEVYKKHDKHVSQRVNASRGKIDGVYAYEDGCLQTFEAAKNHGIHCHYDLPIGYWRSSQKILEEEKKRWPEWATTMVGVKNSQAKLNRKDKELQLADSIYVASSFTLKTLEDYPGNLNAINVVPYGFPAVAAERDYSTASGRKLKLLFVGGLSQRKGIADLFEVVKKLKSEVSLTVVGHKPSQPCEALNEALSSCKYIPTLPHEDILKLMREHDVFVFPSMFEGFGLVITEAMSQGTPVITTYNTAGADFIENGKNGWLINAGATNELQEAIELLINNPEAVATNGAAARLTASKRPWRMYGEELAMTVRKKATVVA